ncbi:MAG: acetyl-CoA carboxylase carboxyltransferase subunit beta [Nitrospirae bacterium]|nr:acetyl-CoA carboxylase carboxyltransferase subunit beta [Nitrospirota bacterium]
MGLFEKSIPQELWVKCEGCHEVIFKKEVDRGMGVCPKCQYHFRLTVTERLQMVLDDGALVEWDATIGTTDILGFRDTTTYPDRIEQAQKKTGLTEAVVTGEGRIMNRAVAVGVMDFRFMGGSMGYAVGERISRLFDRARERDCPVVLFSASGGARMQEGIISLMQMAKTSAAVSRFREVGKPFVSVLTDPTAGGVAASFAFQGDVIMAEPRALIGFAGPRVIEQTIKVRLPNGFQRAEFLLEHGMIDLIVARPNLKTTLDTLLRLLSHTPS